MTVVTWYSVGSLFGLEGKLLHLETAIFFGNCSFADLPFLIFFAFIY